MPTIRLEDKLPEVMWRGEEVATAKLQDLLHGLSHNTRLRLPDEGMKLVLDDTVEMSDKAHVHIVSPYLPYELNTGAPQIKYIGPADRNLFEFDAIRFGRFKGFEVDPGDAATVFNCDGYHPPPHVAIGSQNTFKGIAMANVKKSKNFCAFDVSRTTMSNQEYYRFVDCHIDGYWAGKGVAIGPSANAKHTRFKRGSYQQLSVGIDCEGAGIIAREVNFTSNDLDVNLKDAQEASTMFSCNSEHAKRHLVLGGAGSLTIIGGRMGVNNTVPGTGYIKLLDYATGLTMLGNTLQASLPEGATIFEGITYRGLHLMHNFYQGTKGITLKQLGLDIGKGAWCSEYENITDAPHRATRIASTQWLDQTSDIINTLVVGGGAGSMRIKGIYTLPVTIPKQPALKARKHNWYTFPVSGLTPKDVVLGVAVPVQNQLSFTSWHVPANGQLKGHLANGTTSDLVPPYGEGIALVIRIQNIE